MHTSVGVKLCVVEVSENLLDGLDSPVPSDWLVPPTNLCGTHCLGRNIHLEVSSDEELTSHDCGIDFLDLNCLN
jgi:hypothetical protein